jgi:hypothetical protein
MSRARGCEDLGPWIRVICNHLWWCATNCNGDQVIGCYNYNQESKLLLMYHVTLHWLSKELISWYKFKYILRIKIIIFKNYLFSCNHLWWCATNCNGDQEWSEERFTSIIYQCQWAYFWRRYCHFMRPWNIFYIQFYLS